jgi:hypothetical protein
MNLTTDRDTGTDFCHFWDDCFRDLNDNILSNILIGACYQHIYFMNQSFSIIDGLTSEIKKDIVQ